MVFIPTVLITLGDQVVKACVLARMRLGQSIPVIPNIFHITFVGNRGAAFGILKGYHVLFIAISISVMIWIGIYLIRSQEGFNKIALACICGGALGNTIDRIRLGYVVDFLDFRIWPVFNIADSAITVGIIVLIIQLFMAKRTGDIPDASDHC